MSQNGEGTNRAYIDYKALVDNALRGVLRAALRDIQQRGLLSGHHLYIRYKTAGTPMPDWLRAEYPCDMTICLQFQFRGLLVYDDHFHVILDFKRVPVELTIGFDQVISFQDPWAEFGLVFESALPAGPLIAQPAAMPDKPGDVVSLESFRRPKT